MNYAEAEKRLKMWRFEERLPFGGWSMDHLEGRWESEPLPWNYREEILTRLRVIDTILDIDTGDGDFLLGLRHPYDYTYVTEGDDKDYEYCVEQLAPLGIGVSYCNSDKDELPFDNNMFDMVIDRHGGFSTEQVFRVLKNGGLFITEQIGESDNRALARRLLPDSAVPFPGRCLNNVARSFEKHGFSILRAREAYPKLIFKDVGAVVYFARVVRQEFPSFSVDRCSDKLIGLQEELDKKGVIESRLHRFLLIAQKNPE